MYNIMSCLSAWPLTNINTANDNAAIAIISYQLAYLRGSGCQECSVKEKESHVVDAMVSARMDKMSMAAVVNVLPVCHANAAKLNKCRRYVKSAGWLLRIQYLDSKCQLGDSAQAMSWRCARRRIWRLAGGNGQPAVEKLGGVAVSVWRNVWLCNRGELILLCSYMAHVAEEAVSSNLYVVKAEEGRRPVWLLCLSNAMKRQALGVRALLCGWVSSI
jgi:hypothetical protein